VGPARPRPLDGPDDGRTGRSPPCVRPPRLPGQVP
jgi:hypothetical protein